MNSLEFIEAKIKSTERRIQELRKDKSFAITHNREDEFLDLDSDIEYYEDLLYHLQQVKNTLEAWEVVKDKQVDIFYINICKDANVYNEYKPRLKNLTNEEWDKIKKALEVEDD